MSTPLGLRINNPLNIRFSIMNTWKGQIGFEKGFCKFDTLEHGFRAALVLLCNYHRKGYDSVEKIVTRWAPPSENNTKAYITYCRDHVHVCSDDGRLHCVGYDERLTSYGQLFELAAAMCKMEVGVNPLSAGNCDETMHIYFAFKDACSCKLPKLCV